jgi:hypothetical protein
VQGNFETLAPHIIVEEVADGGQVANALFRLRYKTDAPDFPHHVIAFWNDGTRRVPLCYIHFTAQGEALLGGGACVDSRELRRVPEHVRTAIREAGGLYHYSLAWSVRHFAPHFPAIFGYCGDALAERTDLAVGFSKTQYPRLLVYFTRALDAAKQGALIEQANAVGPF